MKKITKPKMERMQRVNELLNEYFNDENLFFHHKVIAAGEMSRKKGGTVTEYDGKYGQGFRVDVPYWSEDGSNRVHERYYFIKKDKTEK